MPSHYQEKPLKRSLPLYHATGFIARAQGYAYELTALDPHPGLVFDKFIDTWEINQGRCTIQGPENRGTGNKLKLDSKRAWLEETVKLSDRCKNVLKKGLDDALKRQCRLLASLRGDGKAFKTDWRFVSGLGNGHPFETGFIWHRTLGVPYLPGSSVKGMIRAWADPRLDKDEKPQGWGDPIDWKDIKRLFGDTKDEGAGTLIVFDALPTTVPELEVDIMNPHYGDYYRDPVKNPPADYLSPKPVFFLTVKADQPFRFSLAPRPGAYGNDKKGHEQQDKDLEKGLNLLADALRTIGAGGKTAVGYGYFKEQNTMRYASTFLCHSSQDKTLVEAVAKELGRRGVRAWLDKNDLIPGCSLSAAIQKAIDRQETVSVFLSQDAIQSDWVNDELVNALVKAEASGNEEFIIPIYMGDPLALVSSHPLLKRRWLLHDDERRVDKSGIPSDGNSEEASKIAEGVAQRVYDVLKISAQPEVVIYMDQRGDGPRSGVPPSIPPDVQRLDAPALVFRPDLADRSKFEVRSGLDWEDMQSAMRWALAHAIKTPQGEEKKIYIVGDAQFALPFSLGHHFDRSTTTALFCQRRNGSVYTNEGWNHYSPLQGGNPNCQSHHRGLNWPGPLPSGKMEAISLLLMKKDLLQGAKAYIDGHSDSPAPVWVQHAEKFSTDPSSGSAEVKAYIADVVALLQRLKEEHGIQVLTVHLYCTLPVNAVPLLAASLLHVVHKVIFMEYVRDSGDYVPLTI